jgi:hypothetical protein
MEHRYTLRFPFVRGLTTVLLVGGLGVDDEENGLRRFPLLLHVIPFRWDRAKRKPIDQNQEHLMNKSNQFETVFSSFLSAS